MAEETMNSFGYCFAALLFAAAPVAAAPAEPGNPSSIPFLGENPGDAAVKIKVADDIRRFSAGERAALLEIVLSCELNRSILGRRRTYDAWQKGCQKAEAFWNAKYRQRDDRRMIDVQMRIYHGRKLSLTRISLDYFTRKETIARKNRRREDVANDIKGALRLRKQLFAEMAQILKFFFALKDLFAESRR